MKSFGFLALLLDLLWAWIHVVNYILFWSVFELDYLFPTVSISQQLKRSDFTRGGGGSEEITSQGCSLRSIPFLLTPLPLGAWTMSNQECPSATNLLKRQKCTGSITQSNWLSDLSKYQCQLEVSVKWWNKFVFKNLYYNNTIINKNDKCGMRLQSITHSRNPFCKRDNNA